VAGWYSVTEYQHNNKRKGEYIMDTDTTTSVWEFLELPNRYATEAQDLYSWGLNCDRNANPFLVFLDLIGWSKENYGSDMIARDLGYLGYVELGYLADALNEYADAPHEVTAWVDALMMCEGV
jgi:hypothetical protein